MSSNAGDPGRDDNEEHLLKQSGSVKFRSSDQQAKLKENMAFNDTEESLSTPRIEEQKYFTGDKVEALYENTGEWFRGKIIYVQYSEGKATHFDIKFNDYGKIQKATPLESVRSYDCEHEDSMQKKAYTNQCPVMDEAPYEDINEHLITVSVSSKNSRTPRHLTADDEAPYDEDNEHLITSSKSSKIKRGKNSTPQKEPDCICS